MEEDGDHGDHGMEEPSGLLDITPTKEEKVEVSQES